MNEQPVPRIVTFTILIISAVLLSTELLLARLFGTTLWHHLAVFSLTIAMFGIAVGTLAAQWLISKFNVVQKQLSILLSFCCVGLSLWICFSSITYTNIHPYLQSGRASLSTFFFIFILFAPTFAVGSFMVNLCIGLYAHRFERLITFDLIGCALGTLVAIGALTLFDALSLPFLLSAIVAITGIFHAQRTHLSTLTRLLTLLAIIYIFLIELQQEYRMVSLSWTRDRVVSTSPLYEKWTPYSHLTVSGDRSETTEPFLWGKGAGATKNYPPQTQLYAELDSISGTTLTEFTGEVNQHAYLKDDITNIAHHLLPKADVAIIGTGGGRDVLSALVFKQPRIDGFEVNDSMHELLTKTFADFTGNLHQQKGVTLFNQDARHAFTHTNKQYDIIQASLTDTYSSASARTSALSESGIYTVEAWKILLSHLTERGVLSVSRWLPYSYPLEIKTLLSIARESLVELGRENYRNNIVLLASSDEKEARTMTTLLVKHTAFSDAELSKIKNLARSLGFTILIAPSDRAIKLTKDERQEKVLLSTKGMLNAPRDDHPFYFLHPITLSQLTQKRFWTDTANPLFFPLTFSVFFVIVLTVLLEFPWLIGLSLEKHSKESAQRHMLYFIAGGFGYMLIQIALIQRVSMLLSLPSSAIVYLLPTMLIASACGAAFYGSLFKRRIGVYAFSFLLLIAAAAILFRSIDTVTALSTRASLICGFGLLVLGSFPLGWITQAGIRTSFAHANIAWFRAINALAAVVASMVGLIFLTSFGISTTFYIGCGACIVAILLLFTFVPEKKNISPAL